MKEGASGVKRCKKMSLFGLVNFNSIVSTTSAKSFLISSIPSNNHFCVSGFYFIILTLTQWFSTFFGSRHLIGQKAKFWCTLTRLKMRICSTLNSKNADNFVFVAPLTSSVDTCMLPVGNDKYITWLKVRNARQKISKMLQIFFNSSIKKRKVDLFKNFNRDDCYPLVILWKIIRRQFYKINLVLKKE
jgi:hypothetical protein